MAFDLEREHREDVAAARRESLKERLAGMVVGARRAAGRYDAASKLFRLVDRNPDTELIIELARELKL